VEGTDRDSYSRLLWCRRNYDRKSFKVRASLWAQCYKTFLVCDL